MGIHQQTMGSLGDSLGNLQVIYHTSLSWGSHNYPLVN